MGSGLKIVDLSWDQEFSQDVEIFVCVISGPLCTSGCGTSENLLPRDTALATGEAGLCAKLSNTTLCSEQDCKKPQQLSKQYSTVHTPISMHPSKVLHWPSAKVTDCKRNTETSQFLD